MAYHPNPRDLAILGPTCSGKTEVAHRLALDFDGEIISCDSMQIYRELNAGTAKPLKQQRAEIPYHLVDCLSMHEQWNAHKFVAAARKLMEEIHARGRPVILCGGTGLYAKGLIYGLDMQPSDRAVQRSVWQMLQTQNGIQNARDRILQTKPDVRATVLENPRRLARALEIMELAGTIPDNIGTLNATNTTPACDFRQIVIIPEPTSHRTAIHERTCKMVQGRDWIREVQQLLTQGLFNTPTAKQALGYREVASFCSGDIPDADSLIRAIERRTWAYVRRQRTWFRNQHPGAAILTLQADVTSTQIANATRKWLVS